LIVDVKAGNPQSRPQIAGNFKTPEIQLMQQEIRFIKLKKPSQKEVLLVL